LLSALVAVAACIFLVNEVTVKSVDKPRRSPPPRPIGGQKMLQRLVRSSTGRCRSAGAAKQAASADFAAVGRPV